ncbi:ATP-binding protein, partial [Pseudoalteromonas sp. SSM20]|uniref:ATP-binding protein n=1 Tax=Pseudoalteromonas sp. SSM20 TaxID=3139394 RepID=UPI003BABD45E
MQTKILPSRQALVDRIELQFAYGNNFICLISEVGLGKSYLAETFISDKFPEHNKAYIQASRSAQDRHLLGQILEQSFSNPLIDYDLNIQDNFAILSKGILEPLLIVIDNAHFISDEFANELYQLTELYQGKIRILLTATRQLPVLDAINIHLEPLNQSESLSLMRMYFKDLPYEDEPIFGAFLAACHGNPQLLLAWKNENKQQDLKIETRKKQVKIYSWLVFFTVVLVAIASALLYFFKQQTFSQKEDVSEAPTTVIQSHDVSLEVNKLDLIESKQNTSAQP